MNDILKNKFDHIINGGETVVSGKDLDILEENYPNAKIRSIFNPNRCGVLDEYLIWIKEGYKGINRHIIEKNIEIDQFIN